LGGTRNPFEETVLKILKLIICVGKKNCNNILSKIGRGFCRFVCGFVLLERGYVAEDGKKILCCNKNSLNFDAIPVQFIPQRLLIVKLLSFLFYTRI
jgi:hypothetical protein